MSIDSILDPSRVPTKMELEGRANHSNVSFNRVDKEEEDNNNNNNKNNKSNIKRDEMGRIVAGSGGRLKGTKNKMSSVARAVLSDNTGAIVQRCVELALEGDPAAMKICMDRIMPVSRSGKGNLSGEGIAVNIVVENIKDIEGKVVG